MADHELVDQVLSFLRNNWNTGNAPKPVIIDRDDATSDSFADRRVSYDVTDDNAITVGSGPTRQQTPIGTEFDYDVEDGVDVRIEAAHNDHWGHVSGSDEFETIVNEARRAILVERNWPYRNSSGDVHWHTLRTENEANLSSDHRDYYRYDFDVLFEGYEELP